MTVGNQNGHPSEGAMSETQMDGPSNYFWNRHSDVKKSITYSASEELYTVALVGAPNCGKTSLFNALTGLHQHVGNFPGVTVERKVAELTLNGDQKVRLMDLPGTDTLYPNSRDEQITSDILRQSAHPDHPQLVICVIDATQLKRGLVMCSQLIDLGLSVVVALNMIDLIKNAQQKIDINKLSEQLDVPVLEISARKGTGIPQLEAYLSQQVSPSSKKFFTIPARFHATVQDLSQKLQLSSNYAAYHALIQPEFFSGLTTWEATAARDQAGIQNTQADELISNELLVRRDRMEEITSEVITVPTGLLEAFTNRLDKILIHKFWGYFIFAFVMLLIFQAIFAWASYPQDLIDGAISWIKDGLYNILPTSWITDLITEGIITGFGGIIVFIPQIAFLFFFITILEETGYMARVVFLMDRIMRPFGFSGKSIIPLMGGMACAIPSIMMTRHIPNRYERIITILVTPLMSCSARIPVYTLLIAMFIPANTILGFDQRGLYMSLLYLLGFVAALVMAFVFKKILNYQSEGIFVMEMPIYRLPRWKNVGITVWQKSIDFVFGAGKIILGITVILWFLTAFGPGDKMEQIDEYYQPQLTQTDLSDQAKQTLQLSYDNAKLEATYAAVIGKAIEPVIRPLGFDWKIGISLITSFAAREVFVGTMSIIYGQVNIEDLTSEKEQEVGRIRLIDRLKKEKWPDTGKPVYTSAVVWALIVFFAFSMQCMSTLAVTKKEAGWFWAIIMLLYLTTLGYVGALVTYQLLSM